MKLGGLSRGAQRKDDLILALARELRLLRAEISREQSIALYRALMTVGGAVRAGVVALSPLPQEPAGTWSRNNLRIAAPGPKRVLGYVPSVKDLYPFLQAAAESGGVFKAFGDGWGMSNAATSEDWLLPMADSFDHVLSSGGGLCRFAGGTRIKTLNIALDGKASLTNAPGYDQLTFAGAMSMGGHGSGLAIGPLAEQVLELEMLCVKRDGSPVPRRFDRNDPLFPAVVTSLGALGVITEVTIAVEPAYFIDESRERLQWDDLRGELPALFERQRRGELHSVEIWVNPYPVDGVVWCVLGKRWKSAGPPSGQRGWAVTHGTTEQFEALGAIMRLCPAIIPRVLDGALALATSPGAVMPSAIGLDFGTPNLAPVICSECAIDVTQAAETVDSLVRGLQARAQTSNFWVTSPLGLRFVAPGTAWLSPSYDRETCTIEMPLILGTPGATDTLEWFLREAVPEGRPHWGQWNPLSGAEVRARYPAQCISSFASAAAELDPGGVFANAFVCDLLSLSSGTRSPVTGKPLLPGSSCDDAEVRAYSRLFCDSERAMRFIVDVTESWDPLLQLLADAKEQGRSYTSRSGGYAMHTQSIRMPDTRTQYLTIQKHAPDIEVDKANMLLTVSADATWHAIVHKTVPLGLLPKVIVTAPNATVGGTLASNSIGQTSRRFGHEADGLVSVTVAVPGGPGEPPYVRTLKPPAPEDTCPDAQLFRTIIRGFGLVGVILKAQYALIEVPADPNLPSVEECNGTGGANIPGDRCVAKTDVGAFTADRLADALALLPRGPIEEDFYRSCVLFFTGADWVPRVTTTRFVSGQYGPHLLTYEGFDGPREVAELLLSTVPTAAVADLIAAKITENGKAGYHDPACGYLFTMLGNEMFKKQMAPDVSKVMAVSAQMTFIIPEARAVEFLQFAFKTLVIRTNSGDKTDSVPIMQYLAATPALRSYFVVVEKATRLMAQKYLGVEVDTSEDQTQLLTDMLASVVGLTTLVPALFEMIWIPADNQLLSSSYDQSGIAISLTFQGPGVNQNGTLEGFYPFSVLKDNIYRAFNELSDFATTQCGGQVHLTKNVFVGGDSKAFFAGTLGDRLEQFKQFRAQYDACSVLTNRFADTILGIQSS